MIHLKLNHNEVIVMDKKTLDTLMKLGFVDKGDLFERKVFGEMAVISIEFKYDSKIPLKVIEITIKATSEWSEFQPEICVNFDDCLKKYDDIAYHYETQYSQYKHDIAKGRGFPTRGINPDKLIKSDEI